MPLHGAASLASSDPVQILLNAGAEVNAVNGKGETALHVAAGSGLRCLAVVKVRICRYHCHRNESEGMVLHSRSYRQRMSCPSLQIILENANVFLEPSKPILPDSLKL